MSSKKKILLGITGSISAYRMCDLILDLREKDFEVIPILTKDAKQFITPMTIQALAKNKVYEDLFDLETNVKPVHIELAKSADILVVSPASADVIAKLRMGFADNLLTCTALASTAPMLIVPAMNDKMYENKATQENIEVLKSRGAHFLDPISGKLVCSDYAMGHIASNESIIEAIQKILK